MAGRLTVARSPGGRALPVRLVQPAGDGLPHTATTVSVADSNNHVTRSGSDTSLTVAGAGNTVAVSGPGSTYTISGNGNIIGPAPATPLASLASPSQPRAAAIVDDNCDLCRIAPIDLEPGRPRLRSDTRRSPPGPPGRQGLLDVGTSALGGAHPKVSVRGDDGTLYIAELARSPPTPSTCATSMRPCR